MYWATVTRTPPRIGSLIDNVLSQPIDRCQYSGVKRLTQTYTEARSNDSIRGDHEVVYGQFLLLAVATPLRAISARIENAVVGYLGGFTNPVWHRRSPGSRAWTQALRESRER